MTTRDWYSKSPQEVLKKLNVDPSAGLSEEEAKKKAGRIWAK